MATSAGLQIIPAAFSYRIIFPTGDDKNLEAEPR